MHINFHSKKYDTTYQFDIKELPTNAQLNEIKKEVQERIKIADRLEVGDICAEVLAKYVPIGHNTHITTIEI